jgi:alkylhydroperoxidase/carboxymuconolactone decarboxylase family protein YurZ
MTRGSLRPPWHFNAARALVATILGRVRVLQTHYEEAHRAGGTDKQLLEIALMAHLFGGFPRAIQGFRALQLATRTARPLDGPGSSHGRPIEAPPVTGKAETRSHPGRKSARESPGDDTPSSETVNDRSSSEPTGTHRSPFRIAGERLFRKVYGDSAEAVLERLGSPSETFRDAVIEDAYGRILSRPELDASDREWFAVAALVALDCPQQLKSHVLGAMRLGVTRDDLGSLLRLLKTDVAPSNVTTLRQLLRDLQPPTSPG